MRYQEFVESLAAGTCPTALGPGLQALWYDAKGDWHTAHEIVQQQSDKTSARIHAYLHRKEGDDWNARYWHRKAGSTYPEKMSLDQEWDYLVRRLVSP